RRARPGRFPGRSSRRHRAPRSRASPRRRTAPPMHQDLVSKIWPCSPLREAVPSNSLSLDPHSHVIHSRTPQPLKGPVVAPVEKIACTQCRLDTSNASHSHLQRPTTPMHQTDVIQDSRRLLLATVLAVATLAPAAGPARADFQVRSPIVEYRECE